MAKEIKPADMFISRELSWLDFNTRVLDEAADLDNPVLERSKFLAIFAGNLDEFCMVRVAGIGRMVDSKYNERDIFGYLPQDLIKTINARIETITEQAYQLYQKNKKDLEKVNIRIMDYDELSEEQLKHCKRYFDTTLFAIITPMAVDQGRPFPQLPSKTLAFAAAIANKTKNKIAIIPVPKIVARLVEIPSDKNQRCYVLVEELIRHNIKDFFKGYDLVSLAMFRIIRDSELAVDEEESPNLLKSVEREVRKRSRAKVVRLELEKKCDKDLKESLCEVLDFPLENVFEVNAQLDLTFLFELVSRAVQPELYFPSYVPAAIEYKDIFTRIQEGDFMVHLPYQSFQPTVDLITAAAKDKDVLAIKMTLYRTNEDSAIINALKLAASQKKQVTVLVEIKARFDEEKNITWVKELEDCGCHVAYGIAGLKIHSKMTLIVRREEGSIRRYVHLSSGNYNEKTARIYTDIGYFTCNDDFARDISDMFNVVTGYSEPVAGKRVVSAPRYLRSFFYDLIDKEIEFHKEYKNGAIYAKMNSLEDTGIVEKLYQASCAGVKIRLLVRGICVLIPGVEGLSENIKVKSVIGRFLEHSRMYMFNNNSQPRMFLSSADWMRRNLDRRVELLFEVVKKDLKDHLQFIWDTSWKDTDKVRILNADRIYTRPSKKDFNSQKFFIQHYASK